MSRQTLANHPAVSFTVKRPSPLSREVHGPGTDVSFPAPVPIAWPPSNPVSGNSSPLPLSGSNYGDNNSSDEDAGTEDEIITGFDSLGVQRVREIPNKGPLVIPSLANRDWRAAARRRQSSKIFVPDSGKAAVGVGADGSVGGLGTRDTINSGPQLSGIITAKRRKFDSDQMAGEGSVPAESTGDVAIIDSESRGPPDEELTEDQRALRAILSGEQEEVPRIDIIPEVPTPKSETEAYREDVVNRPDSATLEDYARVPVEQFGAALLRGMGWKEGMAASKTRKGPVEPYVPVSRPALLGIGAKERPVEDTTPANGNFRPQRPEKRYVPVVKRARDGTIITNDPQPQRPSSASSSRRASRSPSPRQEGERDSGREYSRRRGDRDDRYARREADSDRERRRDDKDRRARDRERDRDRERGRGSPYNQDRDREPDRNRDRSSQNQSERRERERDRVDRDRDDRRVDRDRDDSRSRP